MTLYGSERAISLSRIIEAIDSIDQPSKQLQEIRNNPNDDLQLKTFGMAIWFLKSCLLESNIQFLKVKGIPDMKLQ